MYKYVNGKKIPLTGNQQREVRERRALKKGQLEKAKLEREVQKQHLSAQKRALASKLGLSEQDLDTLKEIFKKGI